MDDLALIIEAALKAGAIGKSYFKQNPEVTIKGDTSPVTEADLAIDAFLKSYLMAARPDYGWLSEETEDSAARLDKRTIFIVDPIDGTRAFIEGSDEWCISIAVVEDGVPVAGVLFQPMADALYTAALGKGAYKNEAAIHTVAPRSPLLIGGQKPLFALPPEAYPVPMQRTRHVPSLALRIAYVAEGVIDGSFIRANSHDWDIAAAILILAEAGGVLTSATGQPILLAQPNPRKKAMLCATHSALEHLIKVAAQAGLS